MIKINLLPEEMAAGKEGRQATFSENPGSLLVAVVLLVIFSANAAVGGYLLITKSSAENRLEMAKSESERIKASLSETESLYRTEQADLRRMERLISVARSLAPADRLMWARKLNMLPLLVPEGVYLEMIEVSQNVNERETEESIRRRNEWMRNKRGQSPPVERVPVYNQTLRLQGIAYVPDGTDTQRLSQLLEFFRALAEKQVQLPFENEPTSFMKNFRTNVNLFPMTQKRVAGRDVTEFRVDLQARPMTIQ